MRAIGDILAWGAFYALAALAILFLLGEKRRADPPPAAEPSAAVEAPPTVGAQEPAAAPAPSDPPAPVACQFGKRGGGGDCVAAPPAPPRAVRPVRVPPP